LSLGFEQAGFDVLAAVEIDPIHAAVHKFNFPNCAVLPESVTNISGKRIREVAGLGRRRVDVVFGGPPCQGFSLIGKRVMDDPRNHLVRHFVRLAKELDASYFVFENVKGLTVGKHRQFLDELIQEFEDAGYAVRLPWRVLNAASFGVPQQRERLFLLGAKKGMRIPDYPESLFGAGEYRTCREALEDLPDAEEFEELRHGDEVLCDGWHARNDYISMLRPRTQREWGLGVPRKWNPKLLTSSMRSEHTNLSRSRFAETKPGTTEPVSRFFKLSPDGLCNTLRAGTDSSRGAYTSPRPIHYSMPRCVTVREMARLQGFPDWFRFHRTKWHGARQVGNSVPPPLAKVVAETIVRAGGFRPTPCVGKIEMGDSALLAFDATDAARYWGVRNPIAPRNRQSKDRAEPQYDLFGGK